MKSVLFAAVRYSVSLLFLSCIGVGSDSPALANTACSDPVGRVYGTNNSGAPKGKLICNSERLLLRQSSTVPKVEVFCFYSGQKRIFSNSLVVSSVPGCGSVKQIRSVRFCPTNNGLLCDIPKGSESTQMALRLIQPYGRAVMATPESLSWVPIGNVNRYLVQIEGKNVQWQQTVSQSSVQLPSGMQWEFGNAYRITIAAYTNQGRLISARQTVMNQLSEAAIQAVSEQADRVQRFNLDNIDEGVALDLTNLYLSQGLLNEAIQALNLRVRSGSQNPIVYRVLGDVHLFARSPRLARSAYEKAIKFAERKGQATEVAAARSGLAALKQLPPENQHL